MLSGSVENNVWVKLPDGTCYNLARKSEAETSALSLIREGKFREARDRIHQFLHSSDIQSKAEIHSNPNDHKLTFLALVANMKTIVGRLLSIDYNKVATHIPVICGVNSDGLQESFASIAAVYALRGELSTADKLLYKHFKLRKEHPSSRVLGNIFFTNGLVDFVLKTIHDKNCHSLIVKTLSMYGLDKFWTQITNDQLETILLKVDELKITDDDGQKDEDVIRFQKRMEAIALAIERNRTI